MPRRTLSQLIWKSTENGAQLRMPKTIKSDINFQLMFGEAESHNEQTQRESRHLENYDCKVYRDIEHFKTFI
tara:strand:- start:207 stop:422 length:216 start_codon:yes stop_codon:yes gene_type:complete